MNFSVIARLFGVICLVLTVAGCGGHPDSQSTAPSGPASAASQQAGQQAAQFSAQQAAAAHAAKQAQSNGH